MFLISNTQSVHAAVVYTAVMGVSGIHFRPTKSLFFIIIIFINFNLVVTWWQCLFYMYTKMKKVTRKFKSGVLGNLVTISAFACTLRETKEKLCRVGRSQGLPDTDF